MKLIEAAAIKLTTEQEKWINDNLGGMWSAFKVVKGRLNTNASTKPTTIPNDATEVGVPFGKVNGFVIMRNKNIVDCTNFPTKSDSDILIKNTGLKTLEGFTQDVRGDIDLRENKIESLKGLPAELKGSLHMSHNKLKSFEGCPRKIMGGFSVSYNQITSIEHLPEHIERNFWISENKLTSLAGIHRILKHCGGKIDIGGCPIVGGLIGVLSIEGFKGLTTSGGESADSKELELACDIINKYLGKGRQGILSAQDELIDHDLDDFAEA